MFSAKKNVMKLEIDISQCKKDDALILKIDIFCKKSQDFTINKNRFVCLAHRASNLGNQSKGDLNEINTAVVSSCAGFVGLNRVHC